MFCEFKQAGQQSYYYHFSLSAATHEYRVNYDPVNGDWDCYRDGLRVISSAGNLGFTSGTALFVQGETNSTHSQIGRNSPSRLLFANLAYKIGSGWSGMNVTLISPDSPYGSDEPTPGQFRNWTNAH
jgi:hypothetical protein